MDSVQPLSPGESLGPGDEGDHVAELQRRLQQLGYYQGDIDERYSDVTETAVREFQRSYGQHDDGRTGVETWELLSTAAQHAADGQAAGAQAEQDVQPGLRSEDGQWQWDGAQWQPVGSQDQGRSQVAVEATDSAQHTESPVLSEDGQWRWDGTQWLPAHEAGGPANLELAFSVSDPGEWRDLARRSVPFDQWSVDQKMRANDEYQAVMRRSASGDTSQYERDQEIETLLIPYRPYLKVLLEHVATATLNISPEASRKGERVTLEVSVVVGGGPAKGRVIFKVTTSLGLQDLGTKDLVNGHASVSTTSLPRGKLVLAVEYPTQTVPTLGEVVGDTSEVRYEVQ